MKTHGKFGVALFSITLLLLVSCETEQGNWTAVHRDGAYIYGAWRAPSAKIAEVALTEVKHNLRAQGEQVAALPLLTTLAPAELLPVEVVAGRNISQQTEWMQSRAPSTYHRETLYRDRTVAPELYHAYGFQRQAEVEYESRKFGSKPLILLEIFDMGTAENAFGLYSFNTYPQAVTEWVGCKALLSGGYLRFAKGRYFVEIEGYEFATGIREGMIALAKAVSAQIKASPTKVPLLSLLPSSDRISGSDKLFLSNWTLSQIYSSLPLSVPQLTASPLGVSASYRDNDATDWVDARIVFIVQFPDAATAETVWSGYRESVTETSAAVEMGANGEIFVDEQRVLK